MNKTIFWGRILLITAFLFVLCIIIAFQYINPVLYGVDSYYHIKIPQFIKNYGLNYDFPWAHFSTFRNCFSDKEIVFHLLTLPFTCYSNDIHTQARWSIIFFAAIFLLSFLGVLKQYAVRSLQILALLALPLSTLFLSYINVLRPKTMAITIIILLLHFLIERKYIWVLLTCALYTLTHISFPLIVVFVLATEILRYCYERKFSTKNIIYAFAGLVIGIFIHPNYPHNLISLHLNAFLVPWNTIFGTIKLNFGVEWDPSNTRAVIFDFLLLFAGLFTTFLIALMGKTKFAFHTIVFFFATCFFFALSMLSIAYWYLTYPIGIIFVALALSDFLKKQRQHTKNIFLLCSCLFFTLNAFLIFQSNKYTDTATAYIPRNSHYERMAYWAEKNIPAGKLFYHDSWSDSPYFICFNPKNYYFVVLDPIYMYHYSKEAYLEYTNLRLGKFTNPYEVLSESFGVDYGYVTKHCPLYQQIKTDDRFIISCEDDRGVIFQLDNQ